MLPPPLPGRAHALPAMLCIPGKCRTVAIGMFHKAKTPVQPAANFADQVALTMSCVGPLAVDGAWQEVPHHCLRRLASLHASLHIASQAAHPQHVSCAYLTFRLLSVTLDVSLNTYTHRLMGMRDASLCLKLMNISASYQMMINFLLSMMKHQLLRSACTQHCPESIGMMRVDKHK